MVEEKSVKAGKQWWKKLGLRKCWKICTRRNKTRKPQKNPDEIEITDYDKKPSNTTNESTVDAPSSPINSTRTSRIKYGELVKIGYNGGDIDRKDSRYVVYQRYEPNGVKISKQYTAQTSSTQYSSAQYSSSSSIQSYSTQSTLYSISYVLSPQRAVFVEYKDDSGTDMFQIGRSRNAVIDFRVSNSLPYDQINSKFVTFLSRYACRILVDRTEAIAKIFAAGFDSKRNIFLGEKATKWDETGEMDGITTNGVLIMHPKGQFTGGEAESGVWRECSVGGNVLNLRRSRFRPERTMKIEDETTELRDGTLIDLCGVTLIWRSAEGLQNSPTQSDLDKYVVGCKPLPISRDIGSGSAAPIDRPYYFFKCGHIKIYREVEEDDSTEERRCTICLILGPVVALSIGLEPAFYVDSGPPTFAFNPCGHMASEMTVKYWANVTIPKATKEEDEDFKATCPFCRTLLSGHPGYFQLTNFNAIFNAQSIQQYLN